jgi:hypothetical protein
MDVSQSVDLEFGLLTRRSLSAGLLGSCATCIRGVFAQTFPQAQKEKQVRGIICGIAPTSYLNADETPRLSRSGVQELDDHVNEELATLTTLMPLGSGTQKFSFVDDRSQPIGARAIRTAGGVTQILFGITLVKEEIDANPTSWQTAVIGTMAHEWAHGLQYRSGLDEKRFLLETHADFMSGWYLGTKYGFGTIQLDIGSFEKFLYLRGSSKGAFSEDEYGLPEQRGAAMMAGFKLGLADALQRKKPDMYGAADRGYVEVEQIAAKYRAPK